MKRCVVLSIESIDVGMSIKKEIDALMMANPRCKTKRSIVFVVIASIDVGISIEK